jgi:hypothetical protein
VAPPGSAVAAALVMAHPLPNVPDSEPDAFDRALAPAALSAALLRAEKRYEQLEPVVPSHDAAACAASAVAPARLLPAHEPSVPAVQSLWASAVLVPPGAAASAVASLRARHPVPAHWALTSATPSATYPPVPARQPPVVSQVALDLVFTRSAAAAVVVLDVRVAQPATVPLSQIAVTDADVMPNRSLASTSGAEVTVEEVALICAWHAVVPSQRVSPFAVLTLRRPSGPATAFELPVTVPVQPASGQTTWEAACALPTIAGTFPAFSSARATATRSVVAVASLAAMQPLAAAAHSAAVAVRPAVPLVPPVVAAAHPGPAHSAVADDCASVAGASVTGFAASAAASVAVLRASAAVFAASAAVFCCAAVAPGRAATRAASAARCPASRACCRACSAALFCCSATMSATIWPDPAEESVWTWQPLWELVQLPLDVEVPVPGGPRAVPAPFITAGPSLPVAEVRAVPVHRAPPAQSIVAEAIDQLDAPGTVGPPEFALDPGALGAGGVAGRSWPSAGACWSLAGASPVVSEVTVAFAVDRACTSGAITLASGPVEAPELVTAWQTPPETPSHEPSEREPRGSGDTVGSVADAALVTEPVQLARPSQPSDAPAADAADGPTGSRAALTCCACPSACGPDRASAAPGPVDAVETDCT